MIIAVIPLDERPVCTTLLQHIAAVGGITVLIPPAELLPQKRTAGHTEGLHNWLRDQDCDAYIISLDTLGVGGLISSRIGSESLSDILTQWSILTDLDRPIYAFFIIPRIPLANDSDEEPHYWADYGIKLHHLSRGLSQGQSLTEQPPIPEHIRRDWLARRIRQQALVLEAIRLTNNGIISHLVLGIDDAAEHSLSTLAAQDAQQWTQWLGIEKNISIHCGADEIAVTLLAKAALTQTHQKPVRIAIACAFPGGLDVIARYESDPAIQTVTRQIHAAGAVTAPLDNAEAIVVIHPPDRGDWAVAALLDDTRRHQRAIKTAELTRSQTRPVGLADISAPNGFDPILLDEISEILPRLDAIAGWNTAGNTIGTVIAHLVCQELARRQDHDTNQAHQLLKAHRIVEDALYMSVVRGELRTLYAIASDAHDSLSPDRMTFASQWVEKQLNKYMAQLPFVQDYTILPGSITFPWQRSFEINFDLQRSAT